MIRIYINGEEASWKRISDEYGENYCEELKREVKGDKPYSAIVREDGVVVIFK